eukprot:1146333-Prymnesium_polylepis.1
MLPGTESSMRSSRSSCGPNHVLPHCVASRRNQGASMGGPIDLPLSLRDSDDRILTVSLRRHLERGV